LPAELLYL